MRMIGIAVLAAGILALVYGGFSYTKNTHDAKVGPLQPSARNSGSTCRCGREWFWWLWAAGS